MVIKQPLFPELSEDRFKIFLWRFNFLKFLNDLFFCSQLMRKVVQHPPIGLRNLIIRCNLGDLILIQLHPLHQPILNQDTLRHRKSVLTIKVDVIASLTFLRFDFSNFFHFLNFSVYFLIDQPLLGNVSRDHPYKIIF